MITRNQLRSTGLSFQDFNSLTLDIPHTSRGIPNRSKLCGSMRTSRNASPLHTMRNKAYKRKKAHTRTMFVDHKTRNQICQQIYESQRGIRSRQQKKSAQDLSLSKRQSTHASKTRQRSKPKKASFLKHLDSAIQTPPQTEIGFAQRSETKTSNRIYNQVKTRVTRAMVRANPNLQMSEGLQSEFSIGMKSCQSNYNHSIKTAPVKACEELYDSDESHDLFLDDLKQHIDAAAVKTQPKNDLKSRNQEICAELDELLPSSQHSTPLKKSHSIIKKLDPVIQNPDISRPRRAEMTDEPEVRTLVTQSSDNHDLEMSREKKEKKYLKLMPVEVPMPQDEEEPVPQVEEVEEECRYSKLSRQEFKEMKMGCLRSVLESLTASDIQQELLCCRQDERTQIERIFYKHIFYDEQGKSLLSDLPDLPPSVDMNKGDFVYLCGQPGTGKTTMMRTILSSAIKSRNIKTIFMNIMAYGRVKAILQAILTSLEINLSSIGLDDKILSTMEPDTFCHILKQYIRMFNIEKLIFVFDEIDQYTNTGQLEQFAYLVNDLIEIPQACVVGIANSIDFLEFDCCSMFDKQKIIFQAYTPSQLYEIVNVRLVSAIQPYALHLGIPTDQLIDDIFDRKGLRYCTLKLNKMSPDLRKVIEITIDAINRALERISISEYQQDEEEKENSENLSEGREESKEEEITQKSESTKQHECVTVRDFQKSIQQKFESRIRRIISTLPKGRVLLVKAIEECFSTGKQRMVDEIFVIYNKVLRKMGLEKSSFQEMMDGLESFEFYGMISLKNSNLKKHKTSFQKSRQIITLEAEIEELQAGLLDFGGIIGEQTQLQLKKNGEKLNENFRV